MAPHDRPPTSRPRKPAGPWKHGAIPVIGVVGGIGSGKSAVSSLLEGHGAFVLDADKVGHALINQKPVLERVAARFGPGVLTPVGEGAEASVDRKALGAVVFSDPKALRDLESILHPRMRRTFEKAIARVARRREAKAVVLDAAILFEAGWADLCDRVFYVDAPREQRLARVESTRGWTAEVLDAREAAQWPADRKRERADVVVPNAGTEGELAAAVGQAWKGVLASAPRRVWLPPAPRDEPERPPGPPGRPGPRPGPGPRRGRRPGGR